MGAAPPKRPPPKTGGVPKTEAAVPQRGREVLGAACGCTGLYWVHWAWCGCVGCTPSGLSPRHLPAPIWGFFFGGWGAPLLPPHPSQSPPRTVWLQTGFYFILFFNYFPFFYFFSFFFRFSVTAREEDRRRPLLAPPKHRPQTWSFGVGGGGSGSPPPPPPGTSPPSQHHSQWGWILPCTGMHWDILGPPPHSPKWGQFGNCRPFFLGGGTGSEFAAPSPNPAPPRAASSHPNKTK